MEFRFRCTFYFQAWSSVSQIYHLSIWLFLQVGYRQYCITKFGRVIDSPLFPDVASESFAQERCRRLWSIVYQKEPYDIMSTFYKYPGSGGASGQVCPVDDIDGLEELIAAVTRQSSFYYYVGSHHSLRVSLLTFSVSLPTSFFV